MLRSGLSIDGSARGLSTNLTSSLTEQMKSFLRCINVNQTIPKSQQLLMNQIRMMIEQPQFVDPILIHRAMVEH